MGATYLFKHLMQCLHLVTITALLTAEKSIIWTYCSLEFNLENHNLMLMQCSHLFTKSLMQNKLYYLHKFHIHFCYQQSILKSKTCTRCTNLATQGNTKHRMWYIDGIPEEKHSKKQPLLGCWNWQNIDTKKKNPKPIVSKTDKHSML